MIRTIRFCVMTVSALLQCDVLVSQDAIQIGTVNLLQDYQCQRELSILAVDRRLASVRRFVTVDEESTLTLEDKRGANDSQAISVVEVLRVSPEGPSLGPSTLQGSWILEPKSGIVIPSIPLKDSLLSYKPLFRFAYFGGLAAVPSDRSKDANSRVEWSLGKWGSKMGEGLAVWAPKAETDTTGLRVYRGPLVTSWPDVDVVGSGSITCEFANGTLVRSSGYWCVRVPKSLLLAISNDQSNKIAGQEVPASADVLLIQESWTLQSK